MSPAQNGLFLAGGDVYMTSASSLYIMGTDVSLDIGSGSTFDAAGTLFVEGDVDNAGSFNLNDANSEIYGHFENTGTLNSGTSLFELSGANNDTVWLGGNEFYDLEVNNGIGNEVILQGNFSVANQLTMTSGHVNTTNGYTITLADGATITGESNDGYVKGNLAATRLVDGTGAVNFGGMGLTINPGAENMGNVVVVRTTGLNELGQSHKDTESIDRIWDITPTIQPSSNVSLTMEWLTGNDFGLADLTRAQVWKSTDNGINWSKIGPETDVTAGRSITLSVASFSDWTVSDGEALPVELLEFTADAKGNTVELNWATGLEINSDYFELQRSVDVSSFEEIGQVKAQGNSTEVAFYNFMDIAPPDQEEVFYRLKMVDKDGTFEYSGVRTVRFSDNIDLEISRIYPSPFKEYIQAEYFLESHANMEIELLDLTGRRVYHRKIQGEKGQNSVLISDLVELTEGFYEFKIINLNTQREVSRLLSLSR